MTYTVTTKCLLNKIASKGNSFVILLLVLTQCPCHHHQCLMLLESKDWQLLVGIYNQSLQRTQKLQILWRTRSTKANGMERSSTTY